MGSVVDRTGAPLLQHVVDWRRVDPDGCQPALPVRSAADAGALAHRAHPAGVLRHRVPGSGSRRRIPVPAHRRPALPHARQALVADHARAVRRGRRHRHDLVFRARAAVAGVDAGLRERVRPGLHARGLLVLPRSHLHRHLRLRLGQALAESAFPVRLPDRRRWRRRLVLRHLRQRLDEPPVRVHPGQRPGDRRAPVAGAVRQSDVLQRVHAHVLRRLHRDRLPARRRLRLGVPEGPPRPLRAHGVRHRDDRRERRRAAAGDRRRLGGPRRGDLPAGQARLDRRAGTDHQGRRRAPARLVQRPRGRLGHRHPPAAVAARLPQPERRRQRPQHRPARRRSAGQRGAVLFPDDGRDRHAARRARPGLPLPALPPPRTAALAARRRRGRRAAVGGRADRRLDHH